MSLRRDRSIRLETLNERLAAYSRQSRHRSVGHWAEHTKTVAAGGALTAVIPLAAATSAFGQLPCLGSETLNFSGTGVINRTFGSVRFEFRYETISSTYSLNVQAFTIGNASIGFRTQGGDVAFDYSQVLGAGGTEGTPSICFKTTGGSADGFACYSGGGFLVLNNPFGWIQLSRAELGGGFATVRIGGVGIEGPTAVNTHVGICPTILPVELVSFSGVAGDEGVNLAWETASELNNAGFEIQRASDSDGFRKIGFVDGEGTTEEASSYRFLDSTTEPNANYRYRLMQIDFDGSSSYSDVVEVFTEDPSSVSLSEFYPNPATRDRATLKINLADAQQATFEVYDARGAMAYSDSRMLNAGENRINVPTADLAAGTHFVKIQIGERALYRPLVIAR